MAIKQRVYLVVRADRTMRLIKRRPALYAGEVAIPIDLTYPSSGGQILAPLAVTMPDLAPTAELGDRTHAEIAATREADL